MKEQIEYDAVGNVKKRIDAANRETLYDYDTAHRLIKTTDALNKITQSEYNARSQMTKVKDALNQEYVFTYDALGRTLSQTRASSTMSYEYDAVGNRTKRTDYTGRVSKMRVRKPMILSEEKFVWLVNMPAAAGIRGRCTNWAKQFILYKMRSHLLIQVFRKLGHPIYSQM